MRPTERFLQRALEELEVRSLLREADGGRQRAEALAAAVEQRVAFIDASSNDYLGLARWVVSRETLNALEGLEPGSGASRLIHGTRAPHEALERALAEWVGLPRALSFASGYAANVGLMGALGVPGALIVSDALNHASIIDGCRLSKADVRVVPHLDLEAVESALRASSASVRWVVTESYFSMDGDGPDLKALSELCESHGAGLVVDEAHALGVFGAEGAGRCVEAGIVPDALVGTFGKAVGLHGAFIAGSDRLRTFLWNRARSFVFSTAPSPLLAALAVLHVKQLRAADAERKRLDSMTRELRAVLLERGQSVLEGSFGPIVPVLAGSNERALDAARRLRVEGVLTQAIRPPTVPDGTARLRVTVTTALSSAQLERLADALDRALGPGVSTAPTTPSPGSSTSRSTALPDGFSASRSTALPDGTSRSAPSPDGSSTSRSAPSPDGSSTSRNSASRSARLGARARRIVLLGTGTGVGKTRVGAALARALHGRGFHVLGLKPVESGVPDGAAGEDALALALAAGHSLPAGGVTLREGLSPHLAAQREGRLLDVDALAAWVSDKEDAFRETNPEGWTVIETAGGVFSPLQPGATNFDLALRLGPARWILIAPDSLGVLHELTATLEAMRARGRTPDLVVLSAARGPDLSTGTNAAELARLGVAEPVAALERDRDDQVEILVERLLTLAGG